MGTTTESLVTGDPIFLIDALRSLFRLDGEDIFRIRDGSLVDPDGTPSQPYAKVGIYWEGRKYQLSYHRLKFMLAHGRVVASVDHVDRNKRNNCLSNLREASYGLQTHNTAKRPRRLEELPRGVFRVNSGPKPFRASIKINGKMRHLGHFATEEGASEVYERAAKAHYGDDYSPER